MAKRTRSSTVVVALGLAALFAFWIWARGGGVDASLRVYTARAIITMEPERPRATAVAVDDGRIAAVGSLDEVRAALGDRPFELDERFAEKVLLPGFIEPHLHPALAATILPLEIVSAMEWATPKGRSVPVRGHDAFLAAIFTACGKQSCSIAFWSPFLNAATSCS